MIYHAKPSPSVMIGEMNDGPAAAKGRFPYPHRTCAEWELCQISTGPLAGEYCVSAKGAERLGPPLHFVPVEPRNKSLDPGPVQMNDFGYEYPAERRA